MPPGYNADADPICSSREECREDCERCSVDAIPQDGAYVNGEGKKPGASWSA